MRHRTTTSATSASTGGREGATASTADHPVTAVKCLIIAAGTDGRMDTDTEPIDGCSMMGDRSEPTRPMHQRAGSPATPLQRCHPDTSFQTEPTPDVVETATVVVVVPPTSSVRLPAHLSYIDTSASSLPASSPP